MIPPWQKYPEIPLGSLGWRMGRGEDYWIEFEKWFSHLDLDEKRRYAIENPEPESWRGRFYPYGDLAPRRPRFSLARLWR